jgi:hypothetical protein
MSVKQYSGNVIGDQNQIFQNISNSNIDMSRRMIFSSSSRQTIFISSIKEVDMKFKMLDRHNQNNIYFILEMVLMLIGAFVWITDVPFPTFFSSTFFNTISYFSLLILVQLILFLPLFFLDHFNIGTKVYEIEFKNGEFGGKNLFKNFVTKQAQYINISSTKDDENFLFEFKSRLEADKFFSLLNH